MQTPDRTGKSGASSTFTFTSLVSAVLLRCLIFLGILPLCAMLCYHWRQVDFAIVYLNKHLCQRTRAQRNPRITTRTLPFSSSCWRWQSERAARAIRGQRLPKPVTIGPLRNNPNEHWCGTDVPGEKSPTSRSSEWGNSRPHRAGAGVSQTRRNQIPARGAKGESESRVTRSRRSGLQPW